MTLKRSTSFLDTATVLQGRATYWIEVPSSNLGRVAAKHDPLVYQDDEHPGPERAVALVYALPHVASPLLHKACLRPTSRTKVLGYI